MKREAKKRMKKMLQTVFDAPGPLKKDEFLKKLPKAQISHMEFMILQAAYMKKRVWIVSLMILAAVIGTASFLNQNMLRMLSAFMPFIALSVTTENTRSTVYGMEELEMASRFSLRSVLLARLGVFGVFHFLLICLFIPISLQNAMYTPIQAGVYLTVPYLLTVIPGFMAARRFHGKESVYACMGIAAFVSVVFITLGSSVMAIYREEYFSRWMAVFFVLIVMLGAQWRLTIKEAEELKWNLQ